MDPKQVLVKEETSDVTLESLDLTGSKKRQKETALAYFSDINLQIAQLATANKKASDELKNLKAKIKASPAVVAVNQMSKQLKENKKLIDELASRRAGALGLCKKQGIEIDSELKNQEMLNA